MLSLLGVYFLKICRDRLVCNILGVVKIIIGFGLFIKVLLNGW